MITFPLPLLVEESEAPSPSLSSALEGTVDEIWREELNHRPSLFNGKIFTVTEVTPEHILGYYAEYRRFLAQLVRPELFEDLQLSPLAVTGVLCTPQGIIWGKRSDSSTQFPGAWELLPSGGVGFECRTGKGTVDIQKQVLEELREEVGLTVESVSKMRPLCLVYDPQIHLYNCALEVSTDLPFPSILRLREALPHAEHSELALVTPDQLKSFISAQPCEFSKLTETILSHRFQ